LIFTIDEYQTTFTRGLISESAKTTQVIKNFTKDSKNLQNKTKAKRLAKWIHSKVYLT